jgi:hypothetical protein
MPCMYNALALTREKPYIDCGATLAVFAQVYGPARPDMDAEYTLAA